MKKALWVLFSLTLVFAGAFFSRSRPISTAVSSVTRGDLQVEIVEDGVTRIKDRYVITAPITGTLRRLELHAGDRVQKGQIVAHINWFKEWSISAPVNGQVLRVIQESEGDIEKGQPIIEIGDPTDLEVVLDVLTEKAILINPGASVILEKWGGPYPLHGKVSRVEPSAFNKVSSLGVEEQRTNVIIQIMDKKSDWKNLGDNFHLEGHIIIEQKNNILKVPRSALFRNGVSWALYKSQQGKARLINVQIGAQGSEEAEVLEGPLSEGDLVIPYPSQEIQDGTRIVLE